MYAPVGKVVVEVKDALYMVLEPWIQDTQIGSYIAGIHYIWFTRTIDTVYIDR